MSPSLQVSLSSLEVGTMLALSIVEEIDRLLREGKLSRRMIAQQLGVGRATVRRDRQRTAGAVRQAA